MTGAMYSAVAGLKTHMSALNVIGNNIANVNTYGYKASRYTFDESLYTTSRSGSNGTTTMGGRNPAQIGYGCSIGTIDTDMSTKTYNPTGYGLDTMIDGEGFFLLGDKDVEGVKTQEQLQGMKLSRLGNIDFHDGYLVDGNGNVVFGFPAQSNGGAQTIVDDAVGKVYSYKSGNILAPLRYPKIAEDGTVCYPLVNDDGELVYPNVRIKYERDGSGNITDMQTQLWYPGIDDAEGSTKEPLELEEENGDKEIAAADMKWPVLSSVTIDEFSGRISGISSDDVVVVIGHLAIGKVDNPNGVTHTDGRYYQALDGAGNVHVTVMDEALTHLAADPTANDDDENAADDGYRANFAIEGAGDTGIVTGGLEQSGTDLATEISNMILMQRGYQANTRIVTVTDSMLEELVNMKR